MTGCDNGGGGQNLPKNSVTYFMDRPYAQRPLGNNSLITLSKDGYRGMMGGMHPPYEDQRQIGHTNEIYISSRLLPPPPVE